MEETQCYKCNVITNVDEAGYSSFKSNFCICWECNGNTNSTDCEKCEEEMDENQLKFLLDIYGEVDLCLTCNIKGNYMFKKEDTFIKEKNIISNIYNNFTKNIYTKEYIDGNVVDNDNKNRDNSYFNHVKKDIKININEGNNNSNKFQSLNENIDLNKNILKEDLNNSNKFQSLNENIDLNKNILKEDLKEILNNTKNVKIQNNTPSPSILSEENKQEIIIEDIVNNNKINDEKLSQKDKKTNVNDIFIEIKENKKVNINIKFDNEIFNNIKNISEKRIEKYKLMIELYEKLNILGIDKPIKFKKYLEENNAEDLFFMPIDSKSRRMFDKCRKLYIINNYIKIESLLCLKKIDKIFTLKNKEFDELIYLLNQK